MRGISSSKALRVRSEGINPTIKITSWEAAMGHRIMLCAFIAYLMFGLTGCKDRQNTVQPIPAYQPSPSNTVTVVVKGIVDAVDNSLGLLDNSVKKGTAITAIYKLNLSAAPSAYSQPNASDYYDAFGAGDVAITIGNYTFKSGLSTQLSMVNGGANADGQYDGWYIYMPSSLVDGPAIDAKMRGFISLHDPSATALSSTGLVPVPSPASWSIKRIGVGREDNSGVHLFIAGKITEINKIQ
ncbi:MAG TPA: hypothetical protein VN328_05935 [Thermodesulfovibrionales bacterium]|nr:hypothetical protein [Thermodesulfovibrionales bacterium]